MLRIMRYRLRYDAARRWRACALISTDHCYVMPRDDVARVLERKSARYALTLYTMTW